MHRRKLVAPLLCALLAACNAPPVVATAPREYARSSISFASVGPRLVDLFIVVDAVMPDLERARQSAIAESLVRAMITGDVDHPHEGFDIPPLDDLRVMVVPADPGVLRPDEIPEFLFHYGAGEAPESFARRVAEAVATPTPGASPWPQPLEAALFALVRGCVPRVEAGVGIVFVTTRDDCSLADPDLANPASARYSGAIDERCARYADVALQPLARYDALAESRSVAVAVVAGMADEELTLGAGDPACYTPAGTVALMPGRLAALGRAQSSARPIYLTRASVCAADPVVDLQAFLLELAPERWPICLRGASGASALNRNCDLSELRPLGEPAACDALPGREGPSVVEGRSQGCTIHHADGANDPRDGWFATAPDDPSRGCAGGASLRFTRGFQARAGAIYRLECTLPTAE